MEPGPLEFELSLDSKPLLTKYQRVSQRGRAQFASMTVRAGVEGGGRRQAAPAFTVASAIESQPLRLEGVPQWRIAAGNLAAGATAGCSVEAGAHVLAKVLLSGHLLAML